MQSCFDRLLTWSDEKDVVVNFNKTKEMVTDPPSLTSNLPLINTTTGHIERVNSTKLLGLYLDSNLTWHTHIDTMLSKSTQRLYFLKQLSCAGFPQTQLWHFYLTVIRPVLEYAAPVWHHLITKTQADQIEAIQRRAIRIIYTCTHDMPYVSATFVADFPTMSDRRDQLSRKFLSSTLQPTSPLHSLLPPPRDQLPITRLRAASQFPRIHPHQNKKSISPFSRMP